MLFQFTAVSAIIPSLLIIWYFYTRDVYREPARVIWAVFGLGVASVVPVLAMALPVAMLAKGAFQSIYVTGLFEAFCEAAMPEELCKFLVVYLYASRHREFDEPMDGVVYGVAASLGFATLENIMYTMGGGLSVALMRAVTAVPCHAFCGAIMGYFVGQARFGAKGKSRHSLLFQAWFWPMLLHGLYDFPLMVVKTANERGGLSGDEAAPVMALLLMTLASLVVLWVWAVKLTRRLRREQLVVLAAAGGALPSLPAMPNQPATPRQPLPPQPAHAPQPPCPPQPYYTQAPVWHPPYGTRPSPGTSSVWGWVMLILGGLVASGGGLMTLGLVVAFATGQVASEEAIRVVVGGAVIGLLPLAVGGVLFGFGIKKIRQAASPPGSHFT